MQTTWHEEHVDVGDRRVRCAVAGHGEALFCAGGGTTPAHDLLARERRVVVLDDARAAPDAASALRIETFDLMAAAAAAGAAQRIALAEPARVRALVLESPAAEPLPELELPVLVLAGTEAGPEATEAARAFRRLLPNCHLLLVYAAGAAVAGDRPEAFAEAVADFLERHEQFIVSRRESALLP